MCESVIVFYVSSWFLVTVGIVVLIVELLLMCSHNMGVAYPAVGRLINAGRPAMINSTRVVFKSVFLLIELLRLSISVSANSSTARR